MSSVQRIAAGCKVGVAGTTARIDLVATPERRVAEGAELSSVASEACAKCAQPLYLMLKRRRTATALIVLSQHAGCRIIRDEGGPVRAGRKVVGKRALSPCASGVSRPAVGCVLYEHMRRRGATSANSTHGHKKVLARCELQAGGLAGHAVDYGAVDASCEVGSLDELGALFNATLDVKSNGIELADVRGRFGHTGR